MEEALDVVQEAVQLYHNLNNTWFNAFTHDLALSINTKATILSDLGRLNEALDAAVETVRHFRTLAEVQPDAFKPN